MVEQKKNEQPLVSILLSIYNVEKYLEECLDSILKQSYKNIEIVCVNNGSPDNCAEILKKYAQKDKRIKIVTLKENRKLCGGRNAGLDNATGEFICFVDPDDWIEEDHIKSMVDAIQKKDPDGKVYNLVINSNAFNYMKDLKTESINILYDYYREEGNYTIEDYNTNVKIETDIPMWGRLYRKSFLDKYKVRFLEGFQTDNVPFTFKLLAHLDNYCIISKKSYPNSTYWRRMLKPMGVLTETVLLKNLEIPNTLEDLYDYLKQNNLQKKLRVPFHLFFTVAFPAHQDQPRYYEKFKGLMKKMEDDIKNSEGVYTQDDINLCNLTLYSNGVFDFCSKYFMSLTDAHSKVFYRIMLFGFITLFKKTGYNNKKMHYSFLGLPLWKTKVNNKGDIKGYLFNCLPILKIRKQIS